jgi:hypothetical protein
VTSLPVKAVTGGGRHGGEGRDQLRSAPVKDGTVNLATGQGLTPVKDGTGQGRC